MGYLASSIKSLNGSGYSKAIFSLGLVICIYMFGYAMELNSNTEAQILFWNYFEYLGIPYVSAFWFTVGLIYTGSFNKYRLPLLSAVFGIPAASTILRFTNNLHHLYFASVGFTADRYGKLFIVKQFGPWYKVQAIYSVLMILATLCIFVFDHVKSKYRDAGQIHFIAAASAVAVSGMVCTFLRPYGLYIDYMALYLPVTCLLVIITMIRYDFLEAKSMARSKAFESNEDAILLLNRGNKVIDFNKSARRLFSDLGVSLSEGYIKTILKGNSNFFDKIMSDDKTDIELEMGLKKKYFEITTKSVGNMKKSKWRIKYIRDVTIAHELNKSLELQALVDELSGINNRRAFIQYGEKIISDSDANGQNVHLIMIDLDFFKNVNDRYGHQTGDQVIKRLGIIMNETFGPDNITARLGGEEFGVILSGLNDEKVRSMAEIFLKNVASYQHEYNGETFHVTVSIGIAKKTAFGQTLGNLMNRADRALYMSKDNGRNCITEYMVSAHNNTAF
jgi:diguanylate cyclase (GGDEF)-like protein